MSNKIDVPADHVPVSSKDDLVAVFYSGEKPSTEWRVGTEHEKFSFRLSDHRHPSWEEEGGIRDLLLGFCKFGWQPVLEDGRVIAMSGADGIISLEPAGQVELSGAARRTLHETMAESVRHREQCLEVGGDLGLGFLGLGFTPEAHRRDLSFMPKGRYAIMQRYMPTVGDLGLDMMLRTCTVQANLDYGSEADMVKKMRVGLALQPLATALFANSPFTEGKPNGYLSWRSQIWTDTDRDRTGMLPFVFDAGYGYERYVDYALDVPMYFVYRNGAYLDVAGSSFRAFLAGKLDALPGETPTIGDWKDHLSTIFPEVRLKTFLEMRGADSGPLAMTVALTAFWAGLFYDSDALDEAYALVAGWSVGEQQLLRDRVPVTALSTPAPGGGTLWELARRVIDMAATGLRRRNFANERGETEDIYLAPLVDILDRRETLAEKWLARFAGPWDGRLAPIWDEARY